MKRIILTICTMLVLLNTYAQKGICFENSLRWEQLKELAKSKKKYIFLDFYATWCVPCKLMDDSVYSNDSLGDILNARFVSARIQMDSTGMDDAFVRDWGLVGKSLKNKYAIIGYPSFLFFTPDGLMIYKDIGYKSVHDFTRLVERVLNPDATKYYGLLEEYIKGWKNYRYLGELAVFTKVVLQNDTLSLRMALDYKKNFIDKQRPEDLCRHSIVDFFDNFSNLVEVGDPFFKLCYEHFKEVDSLYGSGSSWAEDQLNDAITREDLGDKLIRNNRPIFSSVNWGRVFNRIHSKYPLVDAEKILLNFQISYYRFYKLDWRKWSIYKDMRIRLYPPTTNLEVSFELNDGGAWEVFLYCNDRDVLLRSLQWIDLAILKEKDNTAFLDTKANVLYKAGLLKDAVLTERTAVDESLAIYGRNNNERYLHSSQEYSRILATMRALEPTYLNQGAVWSDVSVDRLRE